ncbi:four helix bundle protein [Membranicola marinus]|uniref:Four helix bundle protein n=1 Tax=Membranihabitans marinus TaxID=1227546 RepID=A0A953I0N0_9BACT|nr:four helix bundle protein [Membranihabitans marinus]MBY5960226.1 four helix bundle protein [Membranihabitans marinus]
MKKHNVIKELSFEFAVTVIALYKTLIHSKKEYVMSKQLLRSGKAIGAIYREAEHAESAPDFIHKMAMVQKECNETMYWLELLHRTEYITLDQFKDIYPSALSLMKLSTKIITSSKARK